MLGLLLGSYNHTCTCVRMRGDVCVFGGGDWEDMRGHGQIAWVDDTVRLG